MQRVLVWRVDCVLFPACTTTPSLPHHYDQQFRAVASPNTRRCSSSRREKVCFNAALSVYLPPFVALCLRLRAGLRASATRIICSKCGYIYRITCVLYIPSSVLVCLHSCLTSSFQSILLLLSGVVMCVQVRQRKCRRLQNNRIGDKQTQTSH